MNILNICYERVNSWSLKQQKEYDKQIKITKQIIQ